MYYKFSITVRILHQLTLALIVALCTSLCLANSTPHTAIKTGTLLTTIYPLYLISQAVTAGIETPQLLIDPKQDVHHLSLKPSDLQKLQQSNFILWLGDRHESLLKTHLDNNPKAVALLSLPQFKAKFRRNEKGEPLTSIRDTHIWFDPQEAIKIAYTIAYARGQQYPIFKNQYLANAKNFSQSLLLVQHKIKRSIPLNNTNTPYWTYHDAYQYIEPSLQLRYAGSVTSDIEAPVSMAQLNWLQQQRKQYPNPSSPICLIVPIGDYRGLQQKLAPLNLVQITENMVGAETFIQGWQDIAQRIKQCSVYNSP